MATARKRKKTDTPDEMSEDEKIVKEAQDHLKEWEDWESDFQTLFRDDTKFANADSDNGWQWPDDIRKERGTKRPTLTINKVAPKVAMIVNDARQNKPSVTIKPVGDDTSFKAAQIWEGLVRHIEYVSNAQTIYDTAVENQVEGGIGYWRVNTKYLEDDPAAGAAVFDQTLVIEPVQDVLGVALDCFIQQKDGADANWGLIFTDVSSSVAERDHPEMDLTATSEGLGGANTWVRDDTVRIAEYYRIKETDDELIYMADDKGVNSTFFRSDVPAKFRKQIEEAEDQGHEVKRRPCKRRKLEWYKIAGNTIVERNLKLKTKYIPIVRVPGIERVIDGKLHRRGHVRNLKDPQRMYNYNTSAEVEQGAMATKTKFFGQKEAFAGNETAWNNMNVQNAAYLTVNGWDDEHDREIPMPQQINPAQSASVYLDGMKIAEHEMDMASGQFEAQEGRQGNEKSGKAIAERQRQGDTVTYHFIDHLAMAIRHTGRIILDWAPHVFDTERVIQVMGRDGTQSKVTISPDLQGAVEEKTDQNIIQVMFNPKTGKYLVEADIGPAYATQRQEAWNAFVQIVTGAPDLINEIGDLMFRSADFPLADKIAERLQRRIKAEKPYLFDDQAPTPAMQQLQQQVKDLTEQTGELLQALAEKRLKLISKEQMRDIDAHEANTKRLTAETNAVVDLRGSPEEQDLHGAIRQVLTQMITGQPIERKVDAADEGAQDPNEPMDLPNPLSAGAPVPGARKAEDGNWYVQHPESGQHMRVEPLQ